ncbi:MAG TPA: universal stress protein [Gemmatimonadaceae bacterium]|nr:universal stress protein [Gemmatimonadaceae bacterium]
MTNAIAETTLNARSARPILTVPTAVLIATDGTQQSDAAISLGYLLSLKNDGDVTVVTVVDRAPIPWGTIDPTLVIDYERGLQQERQSKVRAQVDSFGDKTWTVEVLSGDPATTIATFSKGSRSKLIVVGLGGHGVAARFFGNETALRLMRLSQTPVLAVHTSLRALPKQIMVAMDFSESSIEAARLALEIAAPGATMTLVHVVPWERKDYIPAHWFREHEAYIGGQLKRVAGWLGGDTTCRIHQKVLYGRPGPSLLACAEELDADLVVAGTHGGGLMGRMLEGQTVAKLVRGARRSVLVLPVAAAFQTLPDLEGERKVS